jgi:NAD(P)H-nitrite reductase large subunit
MPYTGAVIVCSCRVVSDRAVTEAIASGARTVHDLAAHCRAATGCGGCWPELERLLTEHAETAVAVA